MEEVVSSNLTRSTKTQPTRLYANILSMGSLGHRVDFGACPRFSHSFNALAGVGTVSATRESPHDLYAHEFLDAGVEALEEIIESHGKFSQYPFHGLGSQTLAWIHRSEWSKHRKVAFLQRVEELVEQGLKHRQKTKNLQRLADDLKRESLRATVDQTIPPGMPLQ